MASAPSRETAAPFARSWVDRVISWIGRLPGPAWGFYAALWLLAALLVTLARWLDGSLEFPNVDGHQVASTFYGPAALGLLHVLQQVAASSLKSFRPALDIDDKKYALLEYELTTIPANGALIGTGVGVLAAAAAVRFDTTVTPELAAASVITRWIILVLIYWAVVLVPILLYNTVRQLQLVTRIHQMATRIDLFKPSPLYAFSALSATAGTGLLLFNYYSALTDPTTFTNPIWYSIFGISVVVAISFFVLPLYGMHRRIAAEKERLEGAAGEGFRAAVATLHRQVDRGDLGDADAVNKTLSSLVLEQGMLAKMSTWPWQADTFRGFITALVLPVALWLITRLLERAASL